ncbi:hypothetical protein GM921_06130 [Pedobacter sp. LMG 31464]|uniref:Uncharacterized protein n=1 Tax=Pedobacter planticolens TaxID=2679964 RepID=A0A923DW58_9SPHI|nr:hypothetical protein [Pedobacter planticolens]MBB2145052.1 hypothetical protein [Pedobacter planticolens]
MGTLKLYDTNIPRASIAAEREYAYQSRSSEQKFLALINLNRISFQMNGGNPLKKPQGLGLIISKPNI